MLNDSPEDREIELHVADRFAHSPLLDLYEGKKIVPLDKGAVKVRVLSKTARILVKDGMK